MTSLVNLKGKKGIIFGIANDRSIAWGIAEKLSKCGAELAFSYVNDSIKKRVIPLAEKCNSNIVLECDVTSDNSVDNFFEKINSYWKSFDFLVHSIAFSDKNQLKGDYVNTSRENLSIRLTFHVIPLRVYAKEHKFYVKWWSNFTVIFRCRKSHATLQCGGYS